VYIKHGKEIFNEYWSNNEGTFYKKIDFYMGKRHFVYDIYWADPKVIFYDFDLMKQLPLAKTVIPVNTNHPYPRIFLHNNLTRRYKNIFEYVIMHEIGHLWLFEGLGIRKEFAGNELEAFADLFSCLFFMKYRNIEDIDQFNVILNNTTDLQAKFYKIPLHLIKVIHNKKMEEIEMFVAKSEASRLSDNPHIFKIANSIEPALDALGDILK